MLSNEISINLAKLTPEHATLLDKIIKRSLSLGIKQIEKQFTIKNSGATNIVTLSDVISLVNPNDPSDEVQAKFRELEKLSHSKEVLNENALYKIGGQYIYLTQRGVRHTREPSKKPGKIKSSTHRMIYTDLACKGNGSYGMFFEGQYMSDKNIPKKSGIKVGAHAQNKVETVQGKYKVSALEKEKQTANRAGFFIKDIIIQKPVGSTHYTSYMIMELVEGDSLHNVLKAHRAGVRTLSAEQLLMIAKNYLDAVAQLHENGVVHLDLKPGNIMVKPDLTVKIIDFGAAKLIGEVDQLAKSKYRFAGSHPYIGPEGLFYDELEQIPVIANEATDVYASAWILAQVLGATLVHCLYKDITEMKDQASSRMFFQQLSKNPQPQELLSGFAPNTIEKEAIEALIQAMFSKLDHVSDTPLTAEIILAARDSRLTSKQAAETFSYLADPYLLAQSTQRKISALTQSTPADIQSIVSDSLTQLKDDIQCAKFISHLTIPALTGLTDRKSITDALLLMQMSDINLSAKYNSL